ncbi:MAG: hypothetical protein EB084_04915 [Proteobacteria bacterium]|nr:hypothetical protein [Pseudomonadota bacterium]
MERTSKSNGDGLASPGDRLRVALRDVGDVMRGAAADARAGACARLDHDRRQVARGLEEVGRVLDQATDLLREDGHVGVALGTRRLAAGLDRAAAWTASRSLEDIGSAIGALARRRPWLMAGACIAVGFATGRMLLSGEGVKPH